ncbi:hypothetical protein F3Y22_tig00110794pilonHSYRG00156 [Hibiscus syriacus]|uniref:Uncharacterized protein n=1 Tax=Hibiscus syriacus TaxID=106335 RepID=A0A6A2ZS49_HIBSY|nr:hypothetical protein F3Y22_tig00110794pilonHSYRG00156 [Hibiscus syriacus]
MQLLKLHGRSGLQRGACGRNLASLVAGITWQPIRSPGIHGDLHFSRMLGVHGDLHAYKVQQLTTARGDGMATSLVAWSAWRPTNIAIPSQTETFIPRTSVNQDAELAKLLPPLSPHGFAIHTWNSAALGTSYITSSHFMEVAKALADELDGKVREKMIQKGAALNFFTTPAAYTPKQFYKFCLWLKSAEGDNWLAEVRRVQKMERRDLPTHTGEYCRLIKLDEEEEKRELKEIRAEHVPASEYELMDELDLAEKIMELYRADCTARKRMPEAWSDKLMEDIYPTYDGRQSVTVSATMAGGENEALQRLSKFAAECRAQPYKGSKDGSQGSIYGANFSCKIFPWLAMGCLSP